MLARSLEKTEGFGIFQSMLGAEFMSAYQPVVCGRISRRLDEAV